MADKSTRHDSHRTSKHDAPPQPPARRSTGSSLIDDVNDATDAVGEGIVWTAKKADKGLDYLAEVVVDLYKDAKAWGKDWFSSSSSTTRQSTTHGERRHKHRSSRTHRPSRSSAPRSSQTQQWKYDRTDEAWEPEESTQDQPTRRLTWGESGEGSSDRGTMVKYDPTQGGTVSRREQGR